MTRVGLRKESVLPLLDFEFDLIKLFQSVLTFRNRIVSKDVNLIHPVLHN